jgi:hypothetical protein
MKQLVTLLLMLFSLLGTAQITTYTGVLKDIMTGEPVGMASVSADNSNIGTTANAEGVFRLIVPQNLKTITITHLSYKPYSFNPVAGDTPQEIFLEPSVIVLEEIVISNQPIDALLKAVVSNSKKHLEKTLLLNTYYREFAKINSNYLKFADGMLDYNVKSKSGSADLYVQQSRAMRLADKDTKLFNNDKMNTGDPETFDNINLFDVRDGVSESYDFKMLKEVLNSKDYDYELKAKTNAQGKTIQIVTIMPKADVKKTLFAGHVVYDVDSGLILEIDIKFDEAHKQYAKLINAILFKYSITEYAKKSSFKIDKDKYIMTYSQNRFGFRFKFKNIMDDTFEFMSDLITIDYKEGEFEFDRKTRYKEQGLFMAGNNFKEQYWKTQNVMLLTSEEEKILQKFR